MFNTNIVEVIEGRLLKYSGYFKRIRSDRIPTNHTRMEYRRVEEKGEANGTVDEARRSMVSKDLTEQNAEDRKLWRSHFFFMNDTY